MDKQFPRHTGPDFNPRCRQIKCDLHNQKLDKWLSVGLSVREMSVTTAWAVSVQSELGGIVP